MVGVLTNLAIGPASAGANYDSTILADGPVSYWPLNESSGTTAHDIAGTNPGTYTGTYTLGQSGIGDGETSVAFTGTASVSTAVTASAALPLSIESWVSFTGTNGSLIAGVQGSPTYPLILMALKSTGGNVAGAGWWTGSSNIAQSAGAINNGAWHHLVGVYTTGHVALYLDGSLAQQISVGATTSTPSTLTIGGGNASSGYANGPTASANGSVAKVALYNYALTSTQVSSHYAARATTPSQPAGIGQARQAVARASSF